MLVTVISYLPAIIGLLLVGLFVYVSNPKALRNRVFSAQSFLISFWLIFLFFADISKNTDQALWLLRFALMFGSIMMLAFYYFALVFPYKTKINKKWLVLTSLPPVIIGLLSLTPLVLSSVVIEGYGVQPGSVGAIYAAGDILSLVYLLAGVGIIATKYKKADIRQKTQIKLVLSGLLIAFMVNILTGFIFTLYKIETNLVFLGGLSVFIFSLFVSIAIIRHGFLDIKRVVARSIAYLLLVTTLTGIYAAVIFGFAYNIFGEDSRFTLQVLPIVAALLLATTAPYFKRLFDRNTNKIFYRDAYDPQQFLDELNSTVVENIELGILLRRTTGVIQENVKSQFCFVQVKGTADTKERLIGSGELNISAHDNKILKEELVKTGKKTVITDELNTDMVKLKEVMSQNNIGLLIRIMPGNDMSQDALYYLIVGSKKSGNIYDKQDVRLMEIIADELLIAIQNSLRFEEIQQFNVTLQQKVNDATEKLQKTNKKLREMDETKDEFISMASHQLRTPLTSVKGYLSMVLDGDAGKLKGNQKELLDQAFVSSQRMVYLIADLLNVSRLKTGKFIIDPSPTNLAKVIESEISQLKEVAKGKKVTLTYDKPGNFPQLMLDETKIRQVIMNFVDNAIYYTLAGGKVRVELREDKSNVYFAVKDDGIGIPQSEQSQLFTKFYRASNARKARPDGTGLGLFMAKKVVNSQGGEVLFESKEGKGSTFGFTFKKSKLDAESKQESSSATVTS